MNKINLTLLFLLITLPTYGQQEFDYNYFDESILKIETDYLDEYAIKHVFRYDKANQKIEKSFYVCNGNDCEISSTDTLKFNDNGDIIEEKNNSGSIVSYYYTNSRIDSIIDINEFHPNKYIYDHITKDSIRYEFFESRTLLGEGYYRIKDDEIIKVREHYYFDSTLVRSTYKAQDITFKELVTPNNLIDRKFISLVQEFDDERNVWVNESKNEISYDSNNRIEFVETFSWGENSGVWELRSKEIYNYFENLVLGYNHYSFDKDLDSLKLERTTNLVYNKKIDGLPLNYSLKDQRLVQIENIDLDDDGTEEILAFTVENETIASQFQLFEVDSIGISLISQSDPISSYPYGFKIEKHPNSDNYYILASWGNSLNILDISYEKNEIYGPYALINEPVNPNFLYQDLNNDSTKDLIFGSPYSNGSHSKIYKSDNDDYLNFSLESELISTEGSNNVIPIKFDNDSLPDVLVGETYSGELNIFKNEGDFKFSNVSTKILDSRVLDLAVADFNNDGSQDFLVTDNTGNINFFYYESGDYFVDDFRPNIGSVFNIQIKDLDYDDDEDIIVNTIDGDIYVYGNMGNKEFIERKLPVSSKRGHALILGNFDGDLEFDLAYGSDSLSVLFNIRNNIGMSEETDITTSQELEKYSKPDAIGLSQNYPNPFNPNTQIRYSIPKATVVKLEVYDMLGKKVATLVNERKSSGQYLVNFDASQLSSGVYIYSIQTGDLHQTKKMLLIK